MRLALHALPHVKHSGVRLSGQGTMREEVAARLQSANLAHGRLSQRVIRSNIGMQLRIRSRCSLVRSVVFFHGSGYADQIRSRTTRAVAE
eukprot:8401914-Pyramimonas_sp.AAC.1